MTAQNVRQLLAPRSAEASSVAGSIASTRALTINETTAMLNVECAATSVHMLSGMPLFEKKSSDETASTISGTNRSR